MMFKKNFLSFLFVIVTCSYLHGQGMYTRNDPFIKEDSMSLALLYVDFTTNMFQGGNVSYYTQYDSCDIDSLPFNLFYIPPVDFGRITFTYTPDGDTLFDGEVLWLGRQDSQYVWVYHPTEYIYPDSFEYVENPVSLPDNAEIFGYDWWPGQCTEEQYKERAAAAWDIIDSLHITNVFAEKPFHVGFYGYPPIHGWFDSTAAKWVIFLYRGKDYATPIKKAQQSPSVTDLLFNTSTCILHLFPDRAFSSPCRIHIVNPLGKVVYKKIIKEKYLDLSFLESGLYVLRVKGEGRNISRKLVVNR